MKNFIKITLFLSIIVLLFGCNSSNSIVGKWVYNNDNTYYTFNKDNSGSYTYLGETKSFIYEDRGNKVLIRYEGNTSTNEFDYTIENNTLTIKDSFGNDIQYKRK